MLQTNSVQTLQKNIPFFRIGFQQFFIIRFRKVQPCHCCFLQRCRCSDCQKIMYLLCRLDHFLRSDQITQAPSGNRIRLRQRITGNRMFIHPRQRSHTGVMIWCIHHMLINFIRHHKGVIPDSQCSNLHQFFSRKYLSAGIGRIADNNCLGTLPESFLYKADIKLIFRRNQWNIDWFCPG